MKERTEGRKEEIKNRMQNYEVFYFSGYVRGYGIRILIQKNFEGQFGNRYVCDCGYKFLGVFCFLVSFIQNIVRSGENDQS